MTISTVPTFLQAFRQGLQARPGLAGVDVSLVPTADTTSVEQIILVNGRIEGAQERFAMARVRQDGYRIPGQLDAFGADVDTDLAFQEAFSRAGAILAEIGQELEHNKPVVGTTTLEGLLAEIAYTPLVVDNGGWVCRCEFVIEYRATVT